MRAKRSKPSSPRARAQPPSPPPPPHTPPPHPPPPHTHTPTRTHAHRSFPLSNTGTQPSSRCRQALLLPPYTRSSPPRYRRCTGTTTRALGPASGGWAPSCKTLAAAGAALAAGSNFQATMHSAVAKQNSSRLLQRRSRPWPMRRCVPLSPTAQACSLYVCRDVEVLRDPFEAGGLWERFRVEWEGAPPPLPPLPASVAARLPACSTLAACRAAPACTVPCLCITRLAAA
jgi:hypothetical protein